MANIYYYCLNNIKINNDKKEKRPRLTIARIHVLACALGSMHRKHTKTIISYYRVGHFVFPPSLISFRGHPF